MIHHKVSVSCSAQATLKRSKHSDNATAITAVYTSQLIQSMNKSVLVLHP